MARAAFHRFTIVALCLTIGMYTGTCVGFGLRALNQKTGFAFGMPTFIGCVATFIILISRYTFYFLRNVFPAGIEGEIEVRLRVVVLAITRIGIHVPIFTGLSQAAIHFGPLATHLECQLPVFGLSSLVCAVFFLVLLLCPEKVILEYTTVALTICSVLGVDAYKSKHPVYSLYYFCPGFIIVIFVIRRLKVAAVGVIGDAAEGLFQAAYP